TNHLSGLSGYETLCRREPVAVLSHKPVEPFAGPVEPGGHATDTAHLPAQTTTRRDGARAGDAAGPRGHRGDPAGRRDPRRVRTGARREGGAPARGGPRRDVGRADDGRPL